MEQRAHSIVLPSFVLKGRYYMIQEQDLLTGSVPKKLIRFAFPLFLANLLQALYNVVDMLVVGKIVGEIGLAAISNASMLCFIINSLCIGLTMGGSVLVAQYKGAGDQKGQRDTIGIRRRPIRMPAAIWRSSAGGPYSSLATIQSAPF